MLLSTFTDGFIQNDQRDPQHSCRSSGVPCLRYAYTLGKRDKMSERLAILSSANANIASRQSRRSIYVSYAWMTHVGRYILHALCHFDSHEWSSTVLYAYFVYKIDRKWRFELDFAHSIDKTFAFIVSPLWLIDNKGFLSYSYHNQTINRHSNIFKFVQMIECSGIGITTNK